MDRLLFGDNQFFGVNHMSEEKARAQTMRFQSLDAVIDVLDAAYDAGVRTFMCTTHDRVGDDRDRRAPAGALPGLSVLPVHARTPTSTPTPSPRTACSARCKRFLPDEGLFDAAIRGGSSMAKKDIEGVTTLLIDAEMKMFDGLRTPVVFLQNVVVDLLLGLGFKDAFRIFADHVKRPLRRRARVHHDEHAGAARRCSRSRASRTRSSARTSTRSASACAAASRPTSGRCASAVPRDRDVGVRLGRDPARGGDRVGVRPAERGGDRVRCLERPQHPAHSRPRGAPLGARAGARVAS